MKKKQAIPLVDANECTLCLIDFQPQMVFGIQSHDRQTIIENVTALAKAAITFEIPTILTTISAHEFSGPLLQPIQNVFPDNEPIERTSMNSWEDKNFRNAVEETGKNKLIMAGLWTEVCLAFPAISALADGYEVYIVTDASAGFTQEAHERAVARMIQAGCVPMTWQQTMLEWQRDWARSETYESIMEILQDHSGAYGQGIFYAQTMVQNYQGYEGFAPQAITHTFNQTKKAS